MTQKRVKASDVIGNSYYIYTLESSNNTPALNGTINITCNVTNVYGQAVSGKSITLYQNNTSKGAKTTDSNGNASWNSISMSSAGLQVFKVENSKIEVFVDNKSDVGHTHSQYLTEHQSLSNYVTTDDSRLSDSRTPTSHTHGNLQNNGQVGSTAQANKNVVTNSSGLIATEDKPTIPSASSTTPSADTTNGSVGTGTTWARSNHTHPKSSLYAESSHNHTKSQITDFPSIPSKTSDLQNDSGFLTSHQDLSNYVTTDDSRLSDARTPTSHAHGIITNDGKVTTNVDVASGDYIIISDVSDSNKIKRTLSVLASHIKDSTAHANIGSSANATQATINTKIDTQLGQLGNLAYENNIDGYVGTVALSNDYNDLDNLPQLGAVALSNDYDDLDNLPTIPAPITVNSLDSGFTTSTMQTSNVFSPTGSSNLMQYHFNMSVNADIGDLWDSIYNKEYQSNKVTSLSSSSTDTQYPSAKCVYDSLDSKEDESNKVSSWSSTTNNTRYPTEKLVKDSLDGKADNNHTHEVLLSSNDDSDIQLFNVSAQGVPQGEGQSLGAFLSEFWKKIYPIGSIYMSVNSTSPATLFGGTWEQIKDTFLLASGDTYDSGSTGGSADATLVSHQHGTSESGEYFVTSESNGANNTRVTYSSSGTRYVDGMTDNTTPFHHRVGTGYVGSSATGKNMPPYLAVNMWKRIA